MNALTNPANLQYPTPAVGASLVDLYQQFGCLLNISTRSITPTGAAYLCPASSSFFVPPSTIRITCISPAKKRQHVLRHSIAYAGVGT